MSMNSKEDFARTLRSLLKRDKISQTKLSQDIGLTTSAISRYCTGNGYPDCEKLIEIAEYFGVSTDYLLTGTSHSDLQACSKCLGLSLKAIECLNDAMHGKYGEYTSIVEQILTDEKFYKNLMYLNDKTDDSTKLLVLKTYDKNEKSCVL